MDIYAQCQKFWFRTITLEWFWSRCDLLSLFDLGTPASFTTTTWGRKWLRFVSFSSISSTTGVAAWTNNLHHFLKTHHSLSALLCSYDFSTMDDNPGIYKWWLILGGKYIFWKPQGNARYRCWSTRRLQEQQQQRIHPQTTRVGRTSGQEDLEKCDWFQ